LPFAIQHGRKHCWLAGLASALDCLCQVWLRALAQLAVEVVDARNGVAFALACCQGVDKGRQTAFVL